MSLRSSLTSSLRDNAVRLDIYTTNIKTKIWELVDRLISGNISYQKFLKEQELLLYKHITRELTTAEVRQKNADKRFLALKITGTKLSKINGGMMSTHQITRMMQRLYTTETGEILSCFNGNPTDETGFAKEVATAIQVHSPASPQYHFNGNKEVKFKSLKPPLFFSYILTYKNVAKSWSKDQKGYRVKGKHWMFNSEGLGEKDFHTGPDSLALPHEEVVKQARESDRFDDIATRKSKGRNIQTPKLIPDSLFDSFCQREKLYCDEK